MPDAKPDVIRRIERETGLKIGKFGNPGYRLDAGRLSIIFLNCCGLRRIPKALIGLNCRVSMVGNQITEVPTTLGNNGGHSIWLQDNLIKSLPPECLDWDAIPTWDGSNVAGAGVRLEGNPLEYPPPGIVNDGIAALQSWFATQGKPQPRTPVKTPERAAVKAAGSPSVGGSSSPQPRQTKIFLCYRREDTQWSAGRIYDNLTSKYGQEQVFRDIDSTPAGIRYSTWIDSRVRQCSVMIVLIGKAWLSAKDRAGQRRLDLPKDWVRREIEAALKHDIPIIPVRIEEARLPSEEELPPSIADLLEFQDAQVTDRRWVYDVGQLIQAIDDLNATES